MPKVKSISASYGSSAEINGVWHKFIFAIEVELEEGDDTAKVKDMAWNTCFNEVEKQFKEVIG
jgi:hypothetical protein